MIKTSPAAVPDPATLRTLYVTQQMAIDDIARLYRVGRRVARQWLVDAGITIRPVGRPDLSLATRGITRPPEEELRRRLNDDRATHRGLAVRYGVSHHTIGRWLNEYGIKRIPRWPDRSAERV